MRMATVELRGVSVVFGDVRALEDVSIAIPDGELAVVIGPSGSGKTTLLRVIAGLQSPVTGTVRVGGERVDSAHTSGAAMVFEDVTKG